MPSPLLRPLTPATEAYQQEQQAMAPINQQAAEMDTIAQAQASEQAFAKQVQGQAAEAERAQRKQIAEQKAQESRQKEMLANAKRAGVKTTFDGGGQEQPVLHPDGQPVFEHGFQGDVQPGDNGHTVDYRDPRGRVYKVPTKAIRSTQDPAGNPLYEFDIKKEDGATDTIRQPVGSKPLWNTDPKTGKMYTGAADPETGSYGQTEIGVDTTVAGKAAIARQKELFDQQQAERKFQSESLMLDQNVRETNLAPVKKQLSEAQAAAKKLEKSKLKYRDDPEKGLMAVQDWGNGQVGETKIDPATNPDDIIKAKAWIEQKTATDKALADAKAAHDPLAAEVQTMQQKRDQLAIEALNHSRSAQVQMMQMEKAQKAGLPVHEPDWQKRIAAARTDPRITSIFSQAELDQMGGPLAEDAKRISLPETTKLMQRAFTPDFNLDGTLTEDPTSAPALPMQRPEASLANHIGERLTADNVPVKGTDVKALTTQALGITEPEKWQVTPSQGISGELGYHTLTHNGEDIGEFSTRENRFVLNPPSSSDMDRQQQRLINTSSDGLPVYFASDTPPLPKSAVSDMIRQGVDISRSSTDRVAVESKLAEAKLSPADLRQKVMNGELSVQDGRLLNETFHGIKDVDASKPAIEAAFGQHLTSPVLGPLFKKGDIATRQGIVNQFMDAYAERAGSNIIAPNRSELAKLRSELLAKADPRGTTGKGVDFALDLPKNIIAPLAGMLVEAVSVPLWYGPRKLLGYKDEAADVIYNGTRDLAQRQLNTANFAHRLFGQGEMKDILGELKTSSDKIQSVDELPDEVAHKLRDAAYDGYHRFTDENAKDVNTTRDNYDIKKDPTLRAMFDRYLKTADGGTFDSMLQMLSMTANDRATQKQTMQYLERPQAATTDNVIERAKLLDMPLNEGKAAQVLTISKQLDSIKDEKQYKNLITQAGKVLGLEKPADVQMALSHLTREETDAPDSWRSLFRAGTVADAGEFATEIGSDILTGALTASIMGAPEAGMIKAAQVGARQGLKRAFMAPVTALRDGFSKVVGGSLDSLAEKSARFGSGRAMLAKTGGELADKYRKLGIATPKLGQPLTAIQKASNKAVGTIKSIAAAAPIEATEEGVSALLQANPNKEDLVNSMVMGALGGTVLVPMFAGAQSLNRAWQSGKRTQSITDYKTGLVDKFNTRMAGQAGFTPLTVADFDIMQGIQDNPAHQTALQDHAAALEELGAATQEHTQNVMDYQDAAAGNAVPAIPESPRLLAAQSNAQRTAANVEGLSSMAFSATDELRALPDDQRPLYTGIAKAVSGATDYTEAEGKALIGLGGQSAVAFQQAQALPADVAGPANVTQLPGAPTVQQTGLGSYRLPAGVRIQVPPQAIAALQERAPSLAGLIGGQMPAPKQSVTTPTATTQNIPQQNAGQQTAAPLPRNPALAGVSDEALAQRHALAVELSNRPGQADAATYAQDAAVMAKEIEARKAQPAAQPSTPVNRLTPALETRLKQHGLTVSYTPEEQAEVNQKWGPQSPFNTPPAFVRGGKGTAVAMPKDAAMDDTPIAENEVLSAVQNVVEKELRKRNTIAGRPLIVTSHYQAHDGGADYNYSNDTVRVNPLRLAVSIWADRSTNPTRAEVARAAELVIDHEVVHAAQMQAARDTFAKLPAGQQAQGFIPWVAEHYGAMWRDDLKDVHDATMKIYGSVLEGRPDWHKAFEALRMIVQERTAGSTSEAATFLTDRLREHLKAALAVLKRWYADVMAGVADKPVIKAEIEAIEALLAKKSPQTAENGAKTPKSSTQLTLSAKDAAPILAFGESIPKDELYDSLDPEWSDGALETEPHVTVLFGLTKHEADPVAAAIADHGPVTVTLGKMSIFENDEFDVLKIDVESPELRALNAKLSKLPNENSYPDYKPHMTIAYLKKGEGKKYVGDSRFAGKKITFDTMTFSPPSELRPELGKPELPLTKATPSLSVQIPLGKGGAKLDATFPDAESLAAFQFQDIIDAATKGKTPEERDAARQRGVSMLAAMMEDTPLSEPELRKKLQGYRESVIEQANAANPLQVFKPTPFHAYAKTDELASKSLPPPAGGDIISGMQGQGIRRIGPPTNSADWSWYRELEADVANSKLKPGEAQRLARARLGWINENVVSRKSGRPIDEAAAELNASADQAFPVESGDQLGRAIMEALDSRAKAKQGGSTPETAQEQQAKDAAASFATLAAGAEGQPFTASQLSRSLENGDEIKIGGEIFTVSEVDPIDEYVRMESDRFGPVEITGEDKVNLNEGPDHLRIGKAPPVTHTMPDGYVLTEEGMNAIGSAPTRAYHGTPHKVDKFSMSKVGTGEGAQAYGFGLYFAGNKSVAQQYQKGLTERDFIRKVQQEFSEGDNQEDALDAIRHLDLSEGQRALIDALAKEDWWGFDYPHQAVQAAIREPQNFDPSPEVLDALEKFGQLYTVDLLPDEEEFLDWDKPLSEQSEKVKAAFASLYDANKTAFDYYDRTQTNKFSDGTINGSALYARLSMRDMPAGNDAQSSKLLASLGIQGIRYFDGGSRFKMQQTSHAWEVLNGAGKLVAKEPTEAAARAAMEKLQTRNYVLFDENLVRIIAENGKPIESLASAPSRYQSPSSMLAATQAQMQGAEGSKPAGLNSMFNPKPRIPATGERTLFQMPNKPAPTADIELARKIVTNLDRVKAVRPLLPDEQAAYDKATADIAAQETLASAPSRITPEQDAEYMAAVESGDVARQQAMVDAAAKAAGYDTKAWHGSPDEDFTVFQKPEKEADEDGFWFSKDRDWASKFGPTRLFYIKDVKTWGGDDFVVKNPSSIKSADPITRDAEGNVIPLSQRFNDQSDSILYSAPTESAPAQAAPDNDAQVREIIASMPQVWQDVLKDFNAGKSVEDIAKDRLYTPEQTAHILSLAQGRFDYLRGALPTKPKVAPVKGGEPLFKGGSPDLAYGSIPAFAAVDQNRGTPEQVTHAEMQEAATRMFAIDPAATEKLVTRWMDGGGMAFSVEDMPDGIKAIVADAQSRKASMALMTAAAQIFTVENAFAGGSSAKSARLIDLYRNSGEEFARALSQRRDVFETPAERNAWFLSEVLLTPPPSIRSEMKRNPANKAKILADWAARADQIKKELLSEGIDIDATMKQMAKERELAAATIPEAIKPALTQAPKSVRQAVKTILEGGTWQDAINASGLGHKAAQKAYNAFRGLRNIGAKIAAGIRETLGSAPSENFTELPEWTDDVNLQSAPIKTPQTQALATHRNRKIEGEIDLKNPLSVNKARVAMQLRKATGFDALSEYWRASILSGPLTAIVNVTSGVSYGAYEATFKKLSAAAMADVARLFGFKPDAPSLRDLPAMIAAVMPSMKEAGRDMIASWNTETTGFDAYASDDGLFSGTSSFKEQFDPALKGLLGKVMRGISFRHMGAADEFVKSFFTRIEVASQAAQIARNEGKTGEALATAMKDLMRPGSLAWERALAQARRITFQDQEVGRGKGRKKLDSPLQPGHATIDVLDNLADAISRTKKGDFGNALKVLSHFVFPFVSTPTNIFKAGVTMSPMGGVLAIIDAARAAQRYSKGNKQEAARIYNAARAFDDITNQIVCWGFILGLSSLVKPGDDDKELPFITGTLPWRTSSPGERENAYRTAPPQSIRIGDTWYSYRRLDPFASSLAFMVDGIRQFQSGKPIDEVWGKIGTGMLSTMQDKTFLQGVSDVMNAISDPERFGTRWFTNIATGFVPNLIRQPVRATDPVFRETDLPNDMGFIESVARRVGFGMYPSPSNPLAPLPAVDAFGRESAKNTGTGQPGTDIMLRLISPLESLDATNVDPLDKKFLRYNMTHDKGFSFTAPPREITRTIGGKEIKISLSDEEYLPYEKSSGQAFHGAMNTIYGGKTADYSEQDHDDIVHLRTKVIKPFTDDAFSKALRKRQADQR